MLKIKLTNIFKEIRKIKKHFCPSSCLICSNSDLSSIVGLGLCSHTQKHIGICSFIASIIFYNRWVIWFWLRILSKKRGLIILNNPKHFLAWEVYSFLLLLTCCKQLLNAWNGLFVRCVNYATQSIQRIFKDM